MHRMKERVKLLRGNLEAIVWVAALVWLALSDPAGGTHYTLCPLANLGFHWCPGCGLGRAISCVFHGELAESLHYHFLGAPAILILLGRIVTLAKNASVRKIQLPSDHYPSKENTCQTLCS
jgi:hypothetical protein